MDTSKLHFVIAPVDGLCLTYEFPIYSAFLYGAMPNCKIVRQGRSEAYRHPLDVFGNIPLSHYPELRSRLSSVRIDPGSLEALANVPDVPLRQRTCLAFEVMLDCNDYTASEEDTAGLLEWLLQLGDQILDLLRLFLFCPGEDRSIGRAGALGRGVCGLWLGNGVHEAGQELRMRFLARQRSRFELVQDAGEVDFETLHELYQTNAFREFSSAACVHPDKQLPLYDKVFAALRTLRESREMQTLEGRFRQLSPLVEDLANRDEKEQLHGRDLYERIARIAWFSMWDEWDTGLPIRRGRWRTLQELSGDVSGLWGRLRNKLSHTCRSVAGLSRHPEGDLITMETLAISMIRALGQACFHSGATDETVYDILIETELPELEDWDFQEEEGSCARPRSAPSPTAISSPEPARPVHPEAERASKKLMCRSLTEALTTGTCVKCDRAPFRLEDFRDDVSRREYRLSGFCQECQDGFFGSPTDAEG